MADIAERLATALAGRYRIERLLGEGGMATVYLAEDLKHDRKVALKVLRPELAAVLGADRFLQEIKTTARLQHPHILPLYDSGRTTTNRDDDEGLLYYVMPYIEGDTLREKLDRERQLGIDEAVNIATEVADALQHAHDQGVVHRDIKPENIFFRNGHAFVADFGIALAVSAAAGGRKTRTGLSLGTPHYMSPEQAAADPHITHRSDLYSLGCVLYEALTGSPPHTGASTQAIVSKILVDVPRPVTELRKAVPPHVSAAVAVALEKIPADRFGSATSFAAALHNPAFRSPAGAAPVAGPTEPVSRRAGPLAMVVLTLLALVLAAWGWLRPDRAVTAVARHATTLGAAGRLDGLTFGVEAALSPDGATLVFRNPLTGPGQLYVKQRDEAFARPLAGTEGGSGPFFSADGAWIGFVANGQLRRIPSTGGPSLKLADSINPNYNRGAWLEDGSIVHYDARDRTLRHLAPGAARSRVIVSSAMLGGRFPWLPAPLPASRGVLFTAHLTECVGPVSCRPSQVYVYDARRDTVRALFDDAIGAWHVPTGHVLYLASAGTLMAVPWDNEALVPAGRPVPVLDGIQAPGFLVSNDGTAYYVLGRPQFAPGPQPNATVVWIDRNGNLEPVDSSWQVNTGGRYSGFVETDWGLSLSPDGRRIALTMLTDLGTDIWIKQVPRGPVSRLTLHPGSDRAPAWTSDGRAITFLSDRPAPAGASRPPNPWNVWEQDADGTSEPRLLWERDAPTEMSRSADGRWLLLGAPASAGGEAHGQILAVELGVDSLSREVAATAYEERGAALSPDARWLAYVSNEQGTNEVFVRPFPDVNRGKWQVSSGGGNAPLWAHSGRELFYAAHGKMHVVRVNPGPTFSAESPRVLFEIPVRVRAGATTSGTFAISPDDQRFLMVRDNDWGEMAGTPTLVVVQNFFQELRLKLGK